MARIRHGRSGAGLAAPRALLRRPGFRRLWLAAVVSRAGDAVNFTALPLAVYSLTHSAPAVATLVLVEGAALLAGGAASQLVTDRVRPRALLVGLDAVRAVAAAALAVAPVFPAALAVSAVLGMATACFSPASAALVPRLVEGGELPTANALLWTAGVALQLVAAPLGGVLAGPAGGRIAFAVNAASFAVSAVVLLGLPDHPPAAATTGVWHQLPDALRALPRVPVLRRLLGVQALAALGAGASSSLLVVLARDYGLTGPGFGAWLAVIAVGALAGPLLAVPLLGRVAPQRAMAGAYAVRGAGDLALAALTAPAAGAALLGAYGVSTSSGMVSFQTLVQRQVPSEMRGRAFGLLDVTWQTGRIASIAAGAVLVGSVGVRGVFAAGGALLAAAGLLAWAVRTPVAAGASEAGPPPPAGRDAESPPLS